MNNLPGTEPRRRFWHAPYYELIGCALNGHELVGTTARKVRPDDHTMVREYDGVRWYRCLRCDAWLPKPAPEHPKRQHVPKRTEIEVPPRGKMLRDRYVLRLIAVDRAFHVLVLGLLAAAIFTFALHRTGLQAEYLKILNALQGANGGLSENTELLKVQRVFKLSSEKTYLLGSAVSLYALLEGIEMVGLWQAKRWAEYLTLIATSVFLPFEVYEILHKPTVLKITALIINLAIVAYLFYAKRLFGVRGGGAAEHRARQHDMSWEALERATPPKSS